ncbi:MAG TPA: ABC transporter permease [Puia sp.]|nr:ABC transporter permease [Puia sp.]
MLKSYFKIAWRNILRNRTNSIINIAGLAIGIASVILIILYVQDERSYDRFMGNADRIYQVNIDMSMGNQASIGSNTPPPIGPALKREFAQIEAYTRFYSNGLSSMIVSNDASSTIQKHLAEHGLLAVDSNFLQVFDFALKEGEAGSCLNNPNSMVLTESTAKTFFGDAEAVGKSLVLDAYREPFVVTAVVKDIPLQSTIQFDMLIPIAAVRPVKRFSWSWVWRQMNTYVLLDKRSSDPGSISQMESRFPAMVRVQAASSFKRIGESFDEFIRKGGRYELHLQPLTDVHLHSANIDSPFLHNLGSITYVYIFSAIALFIILLACVNFMNLSTAQSVARAKEVGIRKVLGSLRSQMARQFLMEALMYSVISAAFALLIVAAILPAFNAVAGKSLNYSVIFTSFIGAWIGLLVIMTALLAGAYPAFYLSSFNPVEVLKGGGLKGSLSRLLIRNGLVVFQFGVSIALIICTIILFQQLQFTQKRDLGFNKENVIVLSNVEKIDTSAREALRRELVTIPGVLHASVSTSFPPHAAYDDTYVPEETGVAESLVKDIDLSSFMVDEEFIPALKIRLLEGRNFSRNFNDSASVIVNETTVEKIGWKDALGKYLIYPGHNNQRFKVIGVVKDFNTESLHSEIEPFALFYKTCKSFTTPNSYLIASVRSDDVSAVLVGMDSKWKQFAPAVPFDYSFLDKQFEALYNTERRLGSVFGIFTCLSIVIACLGLFGLSVYTAERRKKEIGVRKVIGASVPKIVSLLSREFARLVIIAAVVAFPVAWWVMHNWLNGFAYRITISWWVFVFAFSIAFLIAMVTISSQAIRAAVANPVKSLRAE